MQPGLGSSRDPLAPVCDGDLFWESAPRAAVRRRCLELLAEGRGVWLSGPPGSGRSTVLDRLAADLAGEGRAVLRAEAPVTGAAEEFVAGLLAGVADGPPPEGLLLAAEALYARLLEAFAARGTVPCFPGAVSASGGVVAELEVLASLRVLGRPLVALALAGAGDSPLVGLETVRLPPPEPVDLEALLSHRLAVCGATGLLAPAAIADVAARAVGFEDAMARARRARAQASFERALAEVPAPSTRGAEPPRPSLFDPAELDEVSRLLDSLGPSAPEPESF